VFPNVWAEGKSFPCGVPHVGEEVTAGWGGTFSLTSMNPTRRLLKWSKGKSGNFWGGETKSIRNLEEGKLNNIFADIRKAFGGTKNREKKKKGAERGGMGAPLGEGQNQKLAGSPRTKKKKARLINMIKIEGEKPELKRNLVSDTHAADKEKKMVFWDLVCKRAGWVRRGY